MSAYRRPRRGYLRLLLAQDGERVMATKAYRQFFQENERWLVPYAQYCSLRDRYGSADFSTWPAHHQWDEHDRKSLSTPGTKAYGEVAFFYYVQYLLFSQMSEAHAYARQKNVILKGDIPIGVSRYGCDVWMEPRYFNLNGQAGAPPDDFSVNGQNWGLPTYNWEEMLRDGCQWWVRRFQSMASFFDAYRIDHVLGFFRIWEIPIHSVHGLLGQFQPALALTREEIEGYGLHWQEELFTTPFITDWVLDRVFHEKAAFVRDHFLERKTDYYYRMKEAFDTQRKVEVFFATLAADDGQRRDFFGKETTVQDAENLRDGLYALISDVLFVRDHRDPNRFHPRICVQLDFVYESLYDSDKALFNRLYDDYFYRRNNQYWYGEAMRKLPASWRPRGCWSVPKTWAWCPPVCLGCSTPCASSRSKCRACRRTRPTSLAIPIVSPIAPFAPSPPTTCPRFVNGGTRTGTAPSTITRPCSIAQAVLPIPSPDGWHATWSAASWPPPPCFAS